ncbi:MAG TPA: LLM class F420-dependent oxidoreductase [Streptosporangiaceae bacterium]|nr:LLM class F420-dependent oxidoreductase [Streptosporangiaceae bacterium]
MTQHVRDHLGRFGIWRGASQLTPGLAVALEQFGFGALWVGGSPNGDLVQVEDLLNATSTLTVATGIVNIWRSDAHQVAESFARVQAHHPDRFLLGVGAGHPEADQRYAKPYQKLVNYVDALADEGVPAASMVLAALGPKVLRLAAERTAGAHPYLVTPEYTRQARTVLGAAPLLAPEQKVVLDGDPERARAIGRPRVRDPYLGLVNYTSNLRRLGWGDDDLSGGGSDALIDALVAHGDDGQIAARLTEHLDAGADHVCIQLLTAPAADPIDAYRQLAQALPL